MRDYTYLGTIITNEKELRPEIEKKYYKHVGHIVHFFSTEESISIQRKNKSLFDINKTIGNIQSRILDIE